MSTLDLVHGAWIYARRTRRLASHMIRLIPRKACVLDIGCGDGMLARLVLEARPDLTIRGVDVLARPASQIPVDVYDGVTLPFGDRFVDVATLVDVVHHAANPMALLAEARRVARHAVVIKDHNRNGLLADPTLRFMDWIGNDGYGVSLPFNYWTAKQWFQSFRTLGLVPEVYETALGLYPGPLNLVFGRSLHFIVRLMIDRQ